MSDPGDLPRFVAGYSTVRQFILTTMGIVLLAPGACSLVFIVGTLSERIRTGRFDEFVGLAVIVWVVSFVISILGILLIRFARRSAGQVR
jgi:hypothetical protein